MPLTHFNCRKVPEKSYVFGPPANMGCDLWRGKMARHCQHVWWFHTAAFLVSANAMVRKRIFSKKPLAGFLQLVLQRVESLEKF